MGSRIMLVDLLEGSLEGCAAPPYTPQSADRHAKESRTGPEATQKTPGALVEAEDSAARQQARNEAEESWGQQPVDAELWASDQR